MQRKPLKQENGLSIWIARPVLLGMGLFLLNATLSYAGSIKQAVKSTANKRYPRHGVG